jgi:hypothetical protein
VNRSFKTAGEQRGNGMGIALYVLIGLNGVGVGGRITRHAATPLIVALYQSHSDITSVRQWSPMATGNHLIRASR